MTPKTINSIEISSICDNKCPYCPAPTQMEYRTIGNMSLKTFKKALYWVEHFIKQGTQRELNLHGIGEPTLNPDLVEMIRLAREATPGPINFNTNGNHMTEALALECKLAGISTINVTGHNPRMTMEAIKAIKKADIPVFSNQDFATAPNNWGGLVEWTPTVDYTLRCNWLFEGQVFIMWDGRITRCCLDAKGDGVYTNVDADIRGFEITPFSLCKNCHHERPGL